MIRLLGLPHVRTAEGYIERIPEASYTSPYDFLIPYAYEERLVGWPESKVFWAKESGPCLGVAPLTIFSPVDLKKTNLSFKHTKTLAVLSIGC